MNHSQGFLDSIFAAPDNDAVRLVYADWLDENGESERAEFIRSQVESARLPAGAARTQLETYSESIFNEHGAKWLAGTGLPPAVVRFRRGFPDELDFGSVDWEEEPEDGWDSVPDEGLLATLLAALKSWPELRFVRRLVLCSEGGEGEAVVRVLADSPEYGQVTELVLVHQLLNPADFVRLASSQTMTRLRVLSIPVSSNNDTDEVGDVGARAIANSPNFAHLETLELSRTEIGDTGVVALAGSPHLGNLRRLDLSDNEVGDVGALALVASPHLRSLTELIFVGNEANDTILTALKARFGDLSRRGGE